MFGVDFGHPCPRVIWDTGGYFCGHGFDLFFPLLCPNYGTLFAVVRKFYLSFCYRVYVFHLGRTTAVLVPDDR